MNIEIAIQTKDLAISKNDVLKPVFRNCFSISKFVSLVSTALKIKKTVFKMRINFTSSIFSIIIKTELNISVIYAKYHTRFFYMNIVHYCDVLS